MRMKSPLAIVLSFLMLLPVAQLLAQEKSAEADEAPIVSLIKQLAAPDFSKRQAASQQLLKLGEQAIPRLTAAALSDNREVVTRSVDILKGHLKSANEKLQSAARTALKKISAVEDGVGPRLARTALAPPKPRPQPVPGKGIPGFPRIQLQVQGAAQAIKMRNVNGVKDIEVTEKGRSIKIHDDPNQGIKVEITETKDGKPVTRKFEAKNADELKKKHPEAHKLYQQYSQGAAGNIQLRINGQVPGNGIPRIQIAPFKFPGIPANPQQAPGNAKRIVDLRLQQMERMIQSIQKQLELAGEDAGPAKQSLEHLKKALKEIKQAREKLGEDRPET